MLKYDPLRHFLQAQPQEINKVVMTLFQLDEIVKLPISAYSRPQWWANENLIKTHHAQTRSWQLAGWNASPNLKRNIVTFHRKSL